MVVFTLVTDNGEHRIDRYGAFLDTDVEQRSFVKALKFHGRLVGLHLGKYIAWFDGIANRLKPTDNVTLLHCVAHAGHADDFGHDLVCFRC